LAVLQQIAKHGPIGLDIGACGIKLLQFSAGGDGLVVRAAAYHPIPPSLDDPTERWAAVEEAVACALRRHSFLGRNVVTALSCREFQMKNIRLPRMPSEEMGSAVEFEAQDRFEVVGDEMEMRHILAGQVRHGNELKEEIIAIAVQSETVQARLRLFESLKLNPLAIDVTPCAVARCFLRFLRRSEDAKSVNVFLDVGWRGTSIIVTRGGEVSFLKTIAVGGEDFNEAVAKALSMPSEKAGKLRVRIMQETRTQRAGDTTAIPQEISATVADAVRPFVERISREVQLCLRYFAVTFRGQQPSSLTFVGGEAHEPSLLRIVEEENDVPCTIGDPLRGIPTGGLIGSREQRAYRPAWTVACGLALRETPWVERAIPRSTRATTSGPAEGARETRNVSV